MGEGAPGVWACSSCRSAISLLSLLSLSPSLCLSLLSLNLFLPNPRNMKQRYLPFHARVNFIFFICGGTQSNQRTVSVDVLFLFLFCFDAHDTFSKSKVCACALRCSGESADIPLGAGRHHDHGSAFCGINGKFCSREADNTGVCRWYLVCRKYCKDVVYRTYEESITHHRRTCRNISSVLYSFRTIFKPQHTAVAKALLCIAAVLLSEYGMMQRRDMMNITKQHCKY